MSDEILNWKILESKSSKIEYLRIKAANLIECNWICQFKLSSLIKFNSRHQNVEKRKQPSLMKLNSYVWKFESSILMKFNAKIWKYLQAN